MIVIGIIVIVLLYFVVRNTRQICANQVKLAEQAFALNKKLIGEIRKGPEAPPRSLR